MSEKRTARILAWSGAGETTLLEYDPTVKEEVEKAQQVVKNFQHKTCARAIDMTTGATVERLTGQEDEVTLLSPIAGG